MSFLAALFFYFLINHVDTSLIRFVYEEAYVDPIHQESLYYERWQKFVKKYNKTYTGSDFHFRRKQFEENLKMIDDHNLQFFKGLKSYRLDVNHLADRSRYEIANMLNGYVFDEKKIRNTKIMQSFSKLPNEVNWVRKKVVSEVKNQGRCGSCYAFSATGSIEGQFAIKYGYVKSYSEQNIVDCSMRFENQGCSGGLMDSAFKYVEANGGLDTEAQYPYEERVGRCRYVQNPLNLTGYVDIKEGNEEELKKAVALVGPISVAIDASRSSFMFYSDGVYDEPSCSQKSLDHGVLAVGYGEEDGKKYWLVKNSWGSMWGIDGYIKMSRDKNNQCGIATSASYPLID